MADIAARLGVSRQLVSVALRGLPGASSETRERVQKVAEELSYRPHLAARSLRRIAYGHRGHPPHLLGRPRPPAGSPSSPSRRRYRWSSPGSSSAAAPAARPPADSAAGH